MQSKSFLGGILIGTGLLLIGLVAFFLGGDGNRPHQADIQGDLAEEEIDELLGQIEQQQEPREEYEQGEVAGVVRILLPPFVDTTLWESFTLDAGQEIDIIVARTMSDFYELLDHAYTEHSYDIVLVPSEQWQTFVGRGSALPIVQDSAQIFHTVFYPWLFADETTFVPYSIDPILLRHDSVLTTKHVFSFADLQFLINKSADKIPLLFGLTAEDGRIMERGATPYPDYLNFIDLVLYQTDIANSTYVLDLFSTNTVWQPLRFLRHILQTQDTYPLCSDFPRICGLITAYTHMSRGYMSDTVISEQAFGVSLSQAGYEASPLPLAGVAGDPVRGWAFVVSNKSNVGSISEDWLRTYMQTMQATHELGVPLSAVNKRFNIDRQQPMYKLLVDDMFIYEGSKNGALLRSSPEIVIEFLVGSLSSLDLVTLLR